MDAARIIATLGMRPHPEGGHYVETHRAPPGPDGRSPVTCIYFLLARGERSHWHRIDAAEVWTWHAGAPLALSIAPGGEPSGAPSGAPVATHLLGADLAAGERPQAVVPPFAWQAAESRGEWSLVGCVVAPGFSFETFELAPPGWQPA